MKLLEILQKELKEFPEGMFYAVQDDDGEVKFGKHSKLKLAGDIWQRYESGNCPTIPRLELAEDWDSAIVTKEMWDCHKNAKQGHPHAQIMAAYAEDAKTTDKPWELWQVRDASGSGKWLDLPCNPSFAPHLEYRRKPKTHTVNGVEVPDLRIVPRVNEEYYMPNPLDPYLYASTTCSSYESNGHRKNNNLCYEHTEEGKQAAILHAKAWLGIA